MQQAHTQEQQQKEKAVYTMEQCRAAFTSGVAQLLLRELLGKYPTAPTLNRAVIQQTVDQIGRCTREIRKSILPHEQFYLDQNLKRDKLLDMVEVIDIVARIGIEEGQEVYDEFMGLCLDLLDNVFYAEKNRRKMYFPKYKALFELIAREIKADVNGQQGELHHQNGQLFLRTGIPIQTTQIK